MHPKNFGQMLRNHRTRMGFSQRKLAAFSGVDRAYVSRLETGDRDGPSRDVLERLAALLELGKDDRREFFAAAGYAVNEDLSDMLPILLLINTRLRTATLPVRQDVMGALRVALRTLQAEA